MIGRSHALRYKDGVFVVLVSGAVLAGLAIGLRTLGNEDIGSAAPPPALVSALAFAALVAYRHWRWNADLTPRAVEDLGDRRCAVEGVVRALDRGFVSPYSRTECVAWRGWFASSGDFDDDEFSKAVPFVLELSQGGAIVVALTDDTGRVPHAWDHLAHDETAVRHPDRREVNWDDYPRAETFFEGVAGRGRPIPTHRPDYEIVYADGDLVTLAGRFRRGDDTMGFGSLQGLPTYEVSEGVVLAKGPASLHRRLVSPWLRSYWPWYLTAAIGIEIVVQFGALFWAAVGESSR